MPQTFTSPGAAATDALFEYLTQREAKRRQDTLDAITKSTTARQDEVARGQLDLQREQVAGLREQRDAAAELNRQKRALGVIGTLSPDADVDEVTAGVIESGGFGSLLKRTAPTQGAMVTAPEDDPEGVPTYDVIPGTRQFAGTPQQNALRRFIDDPNTTEAQRTYMRARLAAGDENLPYQLFEPPPTQTLFRVSNRRRGVERFDGTGWVPHQGDIPKDAHWLTEPSQATNDVAEMRRIGMFQRVAEARDRSPLIRAGDRTIVLRDAAAAAKKDPSNPVNQLNLAYSYIQALDTYQSVVLAGELQNLGLLGTTLDQLGVAARRTIVDGAFMPPDVAAKIAAGAELLIKTINTGRDAKQAEFRRRAAASGVGDLWDATYGIAPESPHDPSAARPSAGSSSRTSDRQSERWERDVNGNLVRIP